MKVFRFIFVLVSLIMTSCHDEDMEGLAKYTMKDGTSFITTDDVKFYDTECSFISLDNNLRPIPDDIIINQDSEKDSVYGYDYVLSISWEKAIFGKWIENFGLQQGCQYFIENIEVVKIIPSTIDFAIMEGAYNDLNKDSIGINSNTNKRGFVVSSTYLNGGYRAHTLMKRVAYDSGGESLNIYFPINPTLIKWKYFKILSIW